MYHVKKRRSNNNVTSEQAAAQKKVLEMLDGTRSHENRLEIGVGLMQRRRMLNGRAKKYIH